MNPYVAPAPPPELAQDTNGDTALVISVGGAPVVGIGSFHKTLPHNEFGEVDPVAFAALVGAASTGSTFHIVPTGVDPKPPAPGQPAAPFVNPRAGFAREGLGPDPTQLTMPPAPPVLSASTAAEMTELYWMALLRDLPFDSWATDADVGTAVTELDREFQRAANLDAGYDWALKVGLDLPGAANVNVTRQSLFRCGLRDEQKGPLVSQFFLHDAAFGTETVIQKHNPYVTGTDYLTDYATWLRAQELGLGDDNRPYPQANESMETYYEQSGGARAWRRIQSMRDIARFVHKDALHQAYFNAALLLLSWGAKPDAGNPYASATREAGFGTWGGPHLLTLVSEVASRALKVVWRQKWHHHLRLRPEAYGGLMQMQEIGHNGTKRAYGLPARVFSRDAAQRVFAKNGTYFLPMAFTSGSPAHPAYGAGHATVAGACVTVLKAWFDETEKISGLVANGRHPVTRGAVKIVQPGVGRAAASDGTGGSELLEYTGADAGDLTVLGELNKIASNVAMGRSMGGVHWRSDNTRSLRLGEKIAATILMKAVAESFEQVASLSWTTFDDKSARIERGPNHTATLYVNGVATDPADLS